jgi:Domain of unknown function (DUF4394)/PEP-CTERM motif
MLSVLHVLQFENVPMKKLNSYALLLLSSFFSLVPSYASAEIIYATTLFRELITFDSSSPGSVSTPIPITGLVDQFEQIAGIDFRPATGALYAWGNAPGSIYRLYTLDTTTGAATRVPGNTDANFDGTFWGVDFNPQADRLRLVNDNETSLRYNQLTGQLAATDTPLNPAGNVVAAAYDRNDTDPLTFTTLFAIDSDSDSLVRIGGIDGSPSPNIGAVSLIGALGVNVAGDTHFDISQSGVAYAAMSENAGGPVTNFYTINLNTGAASLVGGISTSGLTGMSAFISPIPEPASILLLSMGLMIGMVRRRR